MDRRIAVVGGGFAGLAAAFELKCAGLAATVLEARDRVGGRVWSRELADGTVVEMGAEWIGPGEHTIVALTDRLNLQLAAVGVDFMTRDVIGGEAVSPEKQSETIQVAAQTLAAMDEAVVARSTMGEFIDALPVSEARRAVFRARLQGSFGTDMHNIALRMMGDRSSPLRAGDENAPGDTLYFRLEGGNQSLADVLAAQLPDVRLDHVVTAVTHDEDVVTINGRSGADDFEVVADAVVIAVPVTLVLELGFDPPLPDDVVDAISKVPMGVAAKLAIGTTDRPPLRALQDVEMPYWCWTGRGGDGRVRRAVTAFCGSTQAQQNLATDSGAPSTWLARVESANPDLDFVGAPMLVDWSQDEWARGCYSAFDNPATDASPFLSRPVGRVYFAGEHTNEESATMEGALASGLRAAAQVAETLGR